VSARRCHCGKELRSDNRTGVCHRCRARGRSAILCAGGCGKVIDRRAKCGMCRSCTLTVAHKTAVELAALVTDPSPLARDLHAAVLAYAARRYSETRRVGFLAALERYGSNAGSLLTEER
jgi:hypothetical protein